MKRARTVALRGGRRRATRWRRAIALGCAAALPAFAQGDAPPGVSDEAVNFGQSAAFSGPSQALGTAMRLGIEVAFKEANAAGGVHGRQLSLHSLDDAYEPEAAIANTRNLLQEERVFALIGAVGTPTSRAAVPVAREAGVPYVAPFTGAAFLREAAAWPNVVNLRASYDQETEEMVARLIADRGVKRIAVVYQDDSFGRAGYAGAVAALARRDMVPVAVGVYPRNTTAVKTALLDVRRGNPGAVILIGAYGPVSALIAWARHLGFNPVFITISFVGSNALAQALGPAGAGVFVTQVVPFPGGSQPAVVAEYAKALRLYAPEAAPGFVSLEGYLAGRMAATGLRRCGRDLNRECFLAALRDAQAIDLGGFGLRFGDDNQGSDAVFLTMIGTDGRYVPVATLPPPGLVR